MISQGYVLIWSKKWNNQLKKNYTANGYFKFHFGSILLWNQCTVFLGTLEPQFWTYF